MEWQGCEASPHWFLVAEVWDWSFSTRDSTCLRSLHTISASTTITPVGLLLSSDPLPSLDCPPCCLLWTGELDSLRQDGSHTEVACCPERGQTAGGGAEEAGMVVKDRCHMRVHVVGNLCKSRW